MFPYYATKIVFLFLSYANKNNKMYPYYVYPNHNTPSHPAKQMRRGVVCGLPGSKSFAQGVSKCTLKKYFLQPHHEVLADAPERSGILYVEGAGAVVVFLYLV